MMRTLKILSTACGLLLWASTAQAVTRTVCASGCDFTTIAAALSPAGTGDVISVRANESFPACTTLPNKGTLASPIIIRSDTADGNLPAAGERVTAAHLSFMPNISACAGGASAFTTAAGARDYTLLGLEFASNPEGYGAVITAGTNDSSQMIVANQPRNIIMDRVYILGNSVFGQKVGIDLNGANLTVKNSHIAGIAGVGQDAIAVRCINGTGPILVENNFIESAAENFICGGDDPFIMTSSLVTAGATTTGATLNTFLFRNSTTATIATLAVGQLIALKAGSTYHHTYVRSITTNTITYDAIPSAPDTGAGSDARWGAITNGITIRRNHFSKPVAWMNPILSTPTSVSLVASTASGTLAAGTYCYRVVARQVAGYQGSAISGAGSTESCATLSATGNIAVSWTAVANTSHYRVYGRLTGAPTGYVETTGVTATDTGAALTTSTIPSGTKWQVKNLFELKFGTNILVSGNVFEYAWPGSDIGYAIWLKSNNSGGLCEFCQTKDVIIEKNIIRHVAGGFNILARINSGANISAVLENLTIRNNLLYDSNPTWGSSTVYLMKVEGPVKNFKVDHNTFLNHTGRGFMYLTGSAITDVKPGLVITNNLGRRETYGVFCTSVNGVSASQGSGCLALHATNGVYTYAGNALAGASAGSYPANNVYPTDTAFQAEFENYAGGVNGDYALIASSTYRLTATDGLDRGADINAINTATAGVTTGSATTTVPINITTAGPLTAATQSVPYTTSLGYTGGTGAVTFTLSSGTLPAGLTLSTAGVISGTPTTVATSAFVVLVTDSAAPAQTDTSAVSIAVSAAPVAVNITTTSPLTAGTVPLTYSVTLAAVGGTAPYTYAVTSGTLPAGITVSTSGVVAGVPITAGVYTFTITATDQVGVTDPQAYSLTVAAEAPGCSRGTTVVGGITIERASFSGPVAPTVCVRVGDVWGNTNFFPPRDYVATVASPSATFVAASTVVSTAHDVLSATHGDTVTVTRQAGDILVATEDSNGVIRWDRLPVGALGTVVTSTGDGPAYQAPSSGGTTSATGAPAVQTITMYAGAATTNTNVPALGTELVSSGRNRVQVDTENSTQIVITTYMVGACATSPATVLRIEYWDGAAWQPTGATSPCSTGYKDANAYVTLAVGARGQGKVFRAYYSDGDGAADPSLSALQIRFR